MRLQGRLLLSFALAACLLAPGVRAAAEAIPGPAATQSTEARAAKGESEAKPDLMPDPSAAETWYSAIWVLVIFITLLAILYPTAWKQVLAGLKAREERIRGDIASAESARQKAEASLKDYNAKLSDAESRVRDLIAKATTDAQQIAATIKTQAEQDAQVMKERSLADIERAKNDALNEIYDQAANLATSVAEKILRRNLNADDQRDLVSRSLEQLQALRNN